MAQELQCHTPHLYYYDNKKNGEVDFLVDDFSKLSVLSIEVKSGKDYQRHMSLTRFLRTPEYGIKNAVVLYDGREIIEKSGIFYLPVYFVGLLG